MGEGMPRRPRGTFRPRLQRRRIECAYRCGPRQNPMCRNRVLTPPEGTMGTTGTEAAGSWYIHDRRQVVYRQVVYRQVVYRQSGLQPGGFSVSPGMGFAKVKE